MSVAEQNGVAGEAREVAWPELQRRISRRIARRNLVALWPESGEDGSPLRWGVAVACGELPPLVDALSKIAAGRRAPKNFEPNEAAERFAESAGAASLGTERLAEAVAWAYALPELAVAATPGSISEGAWWEVLGALQSLVIAASEQAAAESVERLIAAGEIGSVLAWRLADLPSCEALRVPAADAILDWYNASGDAVAAAVGSGGRWARLALAAALRTRRLAARQNRRLGAKRSGAAHDLAVWVTALTRPDGSGMLQGAELQGPSRQGPSRQGPGWQGPGWQGNVRAVDDISRSGLLATAVVECGETALRMAVEATLGRSKSRGRLAWKAELPEPAWFDEDARTAVMLPEWDVRRGRLAIDYSRPTPRIEVSGGKRPLIFGDWSVRIERDGQPVRPLDPWSDVCWYSDDDVHYLELELRLEAGLKVQRQIMLLRDDDCLMLADAVVGGEGGGRIDYIGQVPLVSTAHVEEERETRELILVDGKRRALVMPLGLNEWRVGPAAGTFRAVDPEADGGAESTEAEGLRLETRMSGQGRLYAALWFDLDRKRISREQTWRQLTVAESLRILEPHEAAGYRIQSGDDQWLVYRSLSGQRNRTLLGKNLVSDFFCGRFDASDGFVEELIAVDEQAS